MIQYVLYLAVMVGILFVIPPVNSFVLASGNPLFGVFNIALYLLLIALAFGEGRVAWKAATVVGEKKILALRSVLAVLLVASTLFEIVAGYISFLPCLTFASYLLFRVLKSTLIKKGRGKTDA